MEEHTSFRSTVDALFNEFAKPIFERQLKIFELFLFLFVLTIFLACSEKRVANLISVVTGILALFVQIYLFYKYETV